MSFQRPKMSFLFYYWSDCYTLQKPLLTEHKTCSLKGDGMSIEIVPAYNFQEEIRELLTEYTDMLIEGDSDIKN